ncbi:Gfo/Idh/MocA family protein [Azospirillum thermophilum]|uniref:1-carboxy-3-chloro-3,4-dihydroxycyclo hexa-1,5-diene dehydrogenase n=1 Tax=Azospirillum thermophilum TaxID=2202148 RepID=A0A2S2CZ47_9PROT|nr:Gfo/Idh/MocA family oxidoreductase [Azospirillum thermophilum]AWK89749.1 1-carboxy-3-chloro-3,4-dihydroxycyclo hexa-1,5-diene dehydrogenase [Azospirillum thermophilum]
MKTLNVGLVGSGFMGRAHAQAFRAVGGLFDLPLAPVLDILADRDEETARASAAALGFRRHTGDWRRLVEDPAVDVVAVTTPNRLHAPIALAAIAAGKHVYCEKPLATTLADARAMTAAAEARGVVTLVGFNYLKNPMIALAREIVQGGEIGEVTGFRGIHAEDFMADPDQPYGWRCEPDNAGGALADIGSHIIAMARHLAGEITAVSGRLHTVHGSRPAAPGSTERKSVTVDDQAHALVEFAGGATGSLTASWIAQGRKMQLAFELTGTRGSIAFTQERFNELRLYTAGGRRGREGYTLIAAGPEHGDYGAFCPAPGHQIGFNDLKAIEVKALVEAIAGTSAAGPDFREACEVERVAEAIHRSHRDRCWIDVRSV